MPYAGTAFAWTGLCGVTWAAAGVSAGLFEGVVIPFLFPGINVWTAGYISPSQLAGSFAFGLVSGSLHMGILHRLTGMRHAAWLRPTALGWVLESLAFLWFTPFARGFTVGFLQARSFRRGGGWHLAWTVATFIAVQTTIGLEHFAYALVPDHGFVPVALQMGLGGLVYGAFTGVLLVGLRPPIAHDGGHSSPHPNPLPQGEGTRGHPAPTVHPDHAFGRSVQRSPNPHG